MASSIDAILDNIGMDEERRDGFEQARYVTFADDITLSFDMKQEVKASECPLRMFLKPEGESMSIYPTKIKRKPSCEPTERFICVLEGEE